VQEVLSEDEIRPATQLAHAEDPVDEAYLPPTQLVHAWSAEMYRPAGQLAMHEEAPAPENSLMAQLEQAESEEEEYLPAAHSEHVVEAT